MVMTAVRPSTVTARTKPRSTMFTPRSGSMTSNSASRTAMACSPAVPRGHRQVRGRNGGRLGLGLARARSFRRSRRGRPAAGRSAPGRSGCGSSPRCHGPCGAPGRCPRPPARCRRPRTSSCGSRPAFSACTMARSSSRAIGSQVRPGPKRSRARAETTGRPATARSAARASPSVTRSCGSSTCHSAASVVLMRCPPAVLLNGRCPRRWCRRRRPGSRSPVSRASSGLMPRPVAALNSHRCLAQVSVSPSRSPSSRADAWCGQRLE